MQVTYLGQSEMFKERLDIERLVITQGDVVAFRVPGT